MSIWYWLGANDNINERQKERSHYETVIDKTLAAQREIAKAHTDSIDRLAEAMTACANTHMRNGT